VFDAFEGRSFESYAEAESIAGYRIPRPAAEYEAVEGTFLRTGSDHPRPASSSNYELEQGTIVVDVAPAYYWSEGALKLGESATIGSHDGWIRALGDGWIFKFVCGEVDDLDVWCVARSSQDVPRSAFDEFVASIGE
jgi:hypothetical protein